MNEATDGAPRSARLRYVRLSANVLPAFHALCVEPHVRAFLLDGAVVDRAWAEAALATSDGLFASHGAGLWLLVPRSGPTEEPIGFAGFFVLDEVRAEPELVYALTEASTGRGLATEAARACVAFVEARGWERIVAAVDAPNEKSIAVLRKLGFVETHTTPGAFGRIRSFVRHAAQPIGDVALRSLSRLPASLGTEEIVERLVAGERVRIERIVSNGQRTPDDVWYEQDEHEWVLVVSGAARLAFRDGRCDVELRAGDAVMLPARCAHRVAWTTPDEPTVWLAVFFG